MVQPLSLFEVLLFGLIPPSILLTLHPFIKSRIVEVFSLLPVIISFDFIVDIMIFVESFLLGDM